VEGLSSQGQRAAKRRTSGLGQFNGLPSWLIAGRPTPSGHFFHESSNDVVEGLWLFTIAKVTGVIDNVHLRDRCPLGDKVKKILPAP
jgi:hypothetical protein